MSEKKQGGTQMSDLPSQYIIKSYTAELITNEVNKALCTTRRDFVHNRLGGAFCPECQRHYTMLKRSDKWYAPVPHITCVDCKEKQR